MNVLHGVLLNVFGVFWGFLPFIAAFVFVKLFAHRLTPCQQVRVSFSVFVVSSAVFLLLCFCALMGTINIHLVSIHQVESFKLSDYLFNGVYLLAFTSGNALLICLLLALGGGGGGNDGDEPDEPSDPSLELPEPELDFDPPAWDEPDYSGDHIEEPDSDLVLV